MMDNHVRRTGIVAVFALVVGLVTWAHAAATIDAQGAAGLLEHGNLGLAALVVLGVLAPIGVTVTAAAVLVRRIVANSNAAVQTMTALFAAQLTAQQGERENMAEAHRLERIEAAKADRDDRDKQAAERERMCLRHQQHDEASLQALEGLKDGVSALVQRANGGK